MLYPNFKQLHQKYILRSKIGQGGMSKVYLAISKENSLRYAIKIMDTHPDRKEANKKRFRDEIVISKKINSSIVSRVHDYCFDEANDEYYIVFEYIEGEILKDIIQRNGGLTIDLSVNYAMQIAEGLSHIHQNHIIHRDLKSSNIMIDNTNSVKIIDFGIALSRESQRYTSTNKIIGSVHYLPPEAIKNSNSTNKADIYALGIIIYEMLIGQTPFASDENLSAVDIIKKHQKERIFSVKKWNPNIPQSLANIIIKATAKNPDYRYESAIALYYDLETCLSTERALEGPINLKKQLSQKNFLDFLASKWGIIFFLSLGLLSFIIMLVLVMLVEGN
ncbi:serine/threonine protein kinase [Mycoplasma iguanae]|uniref:Serine/threonine protein kinase n=1 Tax=Mycoplasma iguanae TaxID=292461 RepID=A0ABY5R8X2_9MOLU|nr:serine/threonine-protein kinase [Mycoplasma iguanae]UVD81761.1 serine/threonine protein kinase [Mycoplasma iguanae]